MIDHLDGGNIIGRFYWYMSGINSTHWLWMVWLWGMAWHGWMGLVWGLVGCIGYGVGGFFPRAYRLDWFGRFVKERNATMNAQCSLAWHVIRLNSYGLWELENLSCMRLNGWMNQWKLRMDTYRYRVSQCVISALWVGKLDSLSFMRTLESIYFKHFWWLCEFVWCMFLSLCELWSSGWIKCRGLCIDDWCADVVLYYILWWVNSKL